MNQRRIRLDQRQVVLALSAIAFIAFLTSSGSVIASQPEVTSDENRPTRSARQAVKDGNKELLGDHPDSALLSYRQAELLAPEAREIAFVEGLAHYDLENFDQARESFYKARGAETDRLAADAQYSLGTCDHAQALASIEKPQEALGLLENAMRRYQDVLAEHPDHAAAFESNRKAAAIWRELKQQAEQQQQQQDSDQNNENQDEQQKNQQSQSDNQEQNSEQDQQPSDNEESPQDQNQESDPKDAQQEQQEKSQSTTEKQQQISREQAERKLRELMQAVRDRKKSRQEKVQRLPVSPVDKDW